MNLLNDHKKNILIVDDLVSNLQLLSTTLSQQGFIVRCAKNGSAALMGIRYEAPDLILLDIKMPDMDGYEVCQRIKADPQTCYVPIIFLSALDEVLDKVKAFEVGGVDYITKPFQVEEVLVRVKNQLDLQSAKARINNLNQQLEQKVRKRTRELKITNQKLATANKQLKQEIVERQKAQQQIIRDAIHDGLTGLPNRTLLMTRIDHSIKQAKRNRDYLFALLFIDLDRFKMINDSLGHLVGDKLLIAIAQILPEGLRDTDTVARLGGDEFVILLDGINSLKDATHVGDRLQEKLKQPLNIEGHTVITSASIGIALSNTTYENSSQLLRDADIAMYRAKEKGKACYEVFNRAMYLQTLETIELESNLSLAIERKEFLLYYQPIISLQSGKLAGFEALIRWQHPEKGFIPPVEFIPIAEDTGSILAIGDWVLNEACGQLSAWQQQFSSMPEIASWKMSVNLVSQQLQEPQFIQKLDQMLLETGLDSSCLRLEITERVLVDSEESTQNTLAEIKRRKIKLSIDDFGTGYSSLSYLHRLPIDNLKIDRSFVDGINSDTENFEIVKTIITLAHNLGMDAIAEGVETSAQVNRLEALGCEFAQGYLFAKPLETRVIESMLSRQSINKFYNPGNN